LSLHHNASAGRNTAGHGHHHAFNTGRNIASGTMTFTVDGVTVDIESVNQGHPSTASDTLAALFSGHSHHRRHL